MKQLFDAYGGIKNCSGNYKEGYLIPFFGF